jgi:hypothetical protein
VAFDVVREVRKLRGRLPLLVLPRKWCDHSAIVHRRGRWRQACLRANRKLPYRFCRPGATSA